jgi:2-desacetyl-2-hydroxyethyl bacteriochlorophyllide A dehydrogenase
MPTVVQFPAPYDVQLVEAPVQALRPGHFRVRTWYSGISAGTELTAYRGTNPYLTKSWDQGRRLFVQGDPTFAYPIVGWGYSEVGEVVEVADDVRGVRPGAVVAGIWGHRSEGVIPEVAPTWLPIPEGLEPIAGIFARVGAIALNAVLTAEARLGEKCAIFGQGVIGLLATQLARLSGCDVLAVDAMDRRLELAESLGALHTVSAQVDGGAGAAVRSMTREQGADSAIELSGSHVALHEALRSVGLAGRVIASGFYQGDAIGLRLGEEFHHNRIQIICSQIGGTPLALGPRWDQRRLTTTFLREVTLGRVQALPLISDVLDADDVEQAFQRLDAAAPETLQVVLRFPAAS